MQMQNAEHFSYVMDSTLHFAKTDQLLVHAPHKDGVCVFCFAKETEAIYLKKKKLKHSLL